MGSLLLYSLTLAPTVQGFDSAEFTVGSYDLGFVHPPGYPLYLLIGNLFSRLPVSDVGFRLNFMSAFFASMAVFFLYSLLFQQTRNHWASIVSTFLFATSPSYWSQAIRAEVYTLHVLLMTCALLAWYYASETNNTRGYLICYLILGLGVGNHPTTILLWISALVCMIWLERRTHKTIFRANLYAIVLAGAIFLYFPWRAQASVQVDYIRPYFNVDPGNLKGMWWLVSGQAFRCLFLPQESKILYFQELSRLANFLWSGTLGFGIILGLWGWSILHKTRRVWVYLLSLYLTANLILFLAYGAIDKEVMFLPILLVINIWLASGFTGFTKWIASRFENINAQYANNLVGVVLLLIIFVGMIIDWRSVSLRNESQAYDFSRQVMQVVGPSTTIVNHWATASVIDYLQIIEEKRPDVKNFNVDFYFLGIQEDCHPITTEALMKNGWIPWLEDLSRVNRLCFIEPLIDLPEGYQWIQDGFCWNMGTKEP